MYDFIGLGVSFVALACLLGGFFLGRPKPGYTGEFPSMAILIGLVIAVVSAIAFGAGGVTVAAAGVCCGAFLVGLGSGLSCRPD